jgi:hypothetical protein
MGTPFIAYTCLVDLRADALNDTNIVVILNKRKAAPRTIPATNRMARAAPGMQSLQVKFEIRLLK